MQCSNQLWHAGHLNTLCDDCTNHGTDNQHHYKHRTNADIGPEDRGKNCYEHPDDAKPHRTLGTLLIGKYAPASFMQHFIVFVLAVFIGFQVIWNVSHSLHTPLMAVTNAISGIIIVGALLQLDAPGFIVTALAAISVLIATINIVGGFMVTRRMLQMFQRS